MELKELGFGHITADVAIVTTAETAVAISDDVYLPNRTANVVIWAWVQLTTGTGTTAITPRIRRGEGTAGTIIDDAVAITIGAAVGSNEVFTVMATDERDNVDFVDYTLTVQAAGASANGTILQGGLIVFVGN